MAIAFSRSLRSLQSDGWRAPLVGLLLGILLLAVWVGWFFLASVRFNETGRVVRIDENGFLIAEFSTASLARLKRGQMALVRLDSEQVGVSIDTKTVPVQAVVSEVKPFDLVPGQVRLAVLPEQAKLLPTALPDQPAIALSASVEVVVERLSPAQLVLRNVGLTQTAKGV